MKVKELIEELNRYDGDLEILVNGYESGYEGPASIGILNLHTDYHREPYYGPHDRCDGTCDRLSHKAYCVIERMS